MAQLQGAKDSSHNGICYNLADSGHVSHPPYAVLNHPQASRRQSIDREAASRPGRDDLRLPSAMTIEYQTSLPKVARGPSRCRSGVAEQPPPPEPRY